MRKLILILGLAATFHANAEILTGDDCGTNCKWTFNSETRQLILGPNDSSITYTIPANFVQVWNNEVRNKLNEDNFSLTLEKGIERIPNGAFAYRIEFYNHMQSVNLPEGLKEIGEFAFESHTLSSINIPDSVTKIGEHAFQNSSLQSIDIPDSVEIIGAYAFYNVPLTDVTIGEHTPIRTSEKDILIPRYMIYDDDFGKFQLQERIETGYFTQKDVDAAMAYFTQYPDANDYVISYSDGRIFFADGFDRDLPLEGITIHCTGKISVCEANMLTAGYQKGTYNMIQAPMRSSNKEIYNENDGSYTIVDKDGNVIGYKNKRIYTIEEATKVSKPTGNTFKLRYK
ncbi:MAG: leucine-rich repeat domain-containing protein [Alphaproteobacteria bacterium]|nr:leucine-rich repeat domain-containing protein [Alphaproteobacteria bacterium]